MAATKKAQAAAAAKAADQAAGGEPTFEARRGEPKTTYGYTLGDGSARELKSDAKGVVHPQRAEDVAFFDSMGLATVKETQSGIRTIKPAVDLSGLSTETGAAMNAGSSETAEEREAAAARDAADAAAAASAEKGES